MTKLIKRKQADLYFKRVATHVSRSSLTFIVLTGILYWALTTQHEQFHLASVIYISLSITFASALARYGFHTSKKLGSEFKVFLTQFFYILLLLLLGNIFAFLLATFLGEALQFKAFNILNWAVFGTLALDCIYNFLLDGMSQGHENTLIEKHPNEQTNGMI